MMQGQETPRPTPRNQPVTEYELAAEGMRIAFRGGTEDTMTLEYNGQQYRGETLQRERTALGLVVSAVVEVVYDAYTVTLSVTVPQGNRPADQRSISIQTFAVLTTERTSIAGPALVTGQLQSYQVVPLQGTAR